MKFVLFWGLFLAFAFVVESFEEEAVLEDEQGKESFGAEAVNVLADEPSFGNEAALEGDKEKESFEDEAVLEGEQGKESFEDEAVLESEQGKESFKDEAVLEGEQGKESFKDEAVLAGELGKKSFEDEAVLADEQGKEFFEDKAVLEDEQGNDKRRLGQNCKTDADCDRLECCDLFGRCVPKPGPLCRSSLFQCKTNADCLRGQCCFVRQCRPKLGPGEFCSPQSTCLLRCHDDLECRKSRYVYKCLAPLPPTPTTVVPTFQCKTDADCPRGQCCFVRQCRPKRGLGRFCSPQSTCLFRCHDDLVCRKSRYVYKCLALLPPTPTTVVPTASG